MSNNITGTPIVNFGVYNTYDPQTIMCADLSDWKILSNAPSVMRILLPGSSREIIHTWKKDRINIYNSINLGITCLTVCDEQTYEDLPDGIYQFILEGSPTNYNKKRYYLKTDQFRLELDKMYIKANIDYSFNDKSLRDSLLDVEFQLVSAESFTRDGDFQRADRAFCEARNLLKSMKCNEHPKHKHIK